MWPHESLKNEHEKDGHDTAKILEAFLCAYYINTDNENLEGNQIIYEHYNWDFKNYICFLRF